VLEVAGTVLAAQLALKYGIATNAAGGTHHASSEMGAGYTILNDLAITANYLMKHHEGQDPIQTVLVIDCDVHQVSTSAMAPKSRLANVNFLL
jgi:acetoin utilization deacetylase AcuC-like enzyme